MAIIESRIEKSNNRVNLELDFDNEKKKETEKYSHNFDALDFGVTQKEFYMKQGQDLIFSVTSKNIDQISIDGLKPENLEEIYDYLVFDKKLKNEKLK